MSFVSFYDDRHDDRGLTTSYEYTAFSGYGMRRGGRRAVSVSAAAFFYHFPVVAGLRK